MPEGTYHEHVLDHYRHPRNFGELSPADIDHAEDNPLCGDEIRITLRLGRGGTVDDVRFEGRGCAISLASASLLTERVKGKTLAELKALGRDDVVGMLGVPVSPVRLKCALLGLSVLQDGIAGYERRP